jgi:hypothetical protein
MDNPAIITIANSGHLETAENPFNYYKIPKSDLGDFIVLYLNFFLGLEPVPLHQGNLKAVLGTTQ